MNHGSLGRPFSFAVVKKKHNNNVPWKLGVLFLLVLSLPTRTMANTCDTATSTSHHQVEGVHWPLEKDLEHHPHDVGSSSMSGTPQAPSHRLRLNGAGVRSINFFGWEFKVYVAGFYHSFPNPLQSTDDVYEAVQKHPMQFDFTFLRTVPQAKVTEAWQMQLEHSVDHRYDDYERDRDTFIASFGPIAERGTVSVCLHPCGRTVLVDQGARRAVIESHNFQRAFLSMWFGPKAVHPDLKNGLLSGLHAKYTQQQQQPQVVSLEGA